MPMPNNRPILDFSKDLGEGKKEIADILPYARQSFCIAHPTLLPQHCLGGLHVGAELMAQHQEARGGRSYASSPG